MKYEIYSSAYINQQNTSVPSASSVRDTQLSVMRFHATVARNRHGMTLGVRPMKCMGQPQQAAALLDFLLKRGITKMGVNA